AGPSLLNTFLCHRLGRGGFESAVLEILRGDSGYLLPHASIEFPSICVLNRLPLLIGERDRRKIVRVPDRDRGPPLRHDRRRLHHREVVGAGQAHRRWKMCDGWPAGPAPSGMLSWCSRTGEQDDVARVAGFGLAQPSPLWSGAGQVV